MDLGLKGRKAIVCASSRGLGRACALALGQAGVDVVINGLDADRLARTADDIAEKTDVAVTPVAADLDTHEGQAALLAACPEPDILINNNGGPPLRDFRELDREAMLSGVVQNMVTPIELIQKVADNMAERRFGRIVNITSITVRMPLQGLDLSSAARAGLTAFLAGAARPLAEHNVTVNHILPGMFATDRLSGTTEKIARERGISFEEAQRERASAIPARRFGDPDEIGRLCAYLCSAHAGYITGQSILIDGGLFNTTV
ncbi:SDR family oxidoreductase [Kaustia mangrovi]|uniref:SDR family oxidoreductase n=1 Tax=Kaustia mangrovi TaxID=2593653 RepID=A0A7S8C202_9HYPH|nr:SDR family oxidoreductase [Kaustia mangrovi]QPC41827.1 SDR family oxidoreductase [Kaustia mangrovi]